MSRGDLSEAEWRVLSGLLPIDTANRGRGRPPEENRSIIDGILWRLRCGTPWRDVPPKPEHVPLHHRPDEDPQGGSHHGRDRLHQCDHEDYSRAQPVSARGGRALHRASRQASDNRAQAVEALCGCVSSHPLKAAPRAPSAVATSALDLPFTSADHRSVECREPSDARRRRTASAHGILRLPRLRAAFAQTACCCWALNAFPRA